MRTPLTVQVSDGITTRDVTANTKGLRFTRTAFGGDGDMSASLTLPLFTFEGLGPNDPVEIFDARTGDTVWSGNTDNPGATRGPRGQSYELHAFGAAARMQYMTKSLAYVDTALDLFNRSTNSSPGAQTSNDERPDGSPTLRVGVAEGKSVGTSWQGEWVCRRFQQENLKVARFRAITRSGVSDANYSVQLRAGTTAANVAIVDSAAASAIVDTTLGAWRGSGTRPLGGTDDVVAFRAARTTSTITGADAHWHEIWDIVVRQTLKNPDGSDVTTGYGINTVYAHEVIADMLGRGMCPGIDPTKVTLPTTTYPLTPLAWWDGVTMTDALGQLLIFEPDLWWAAAGDTFTAGFWDDDNPRYVVSQREGGIESPGEELTLCNRISVDWTDKRGRERTTVVTTAVDGLDYTRDAEPISLPDGLGSEENAQRAGDMALAITNKKPRAGTAVIRQPIRDRLTGYDVLPFEILPGYTVLERESGEVLRLTEMEYSDEDGAATLTLNRPVRSLEQRLARMAPPKRRRPRGLLM